MCGRFTLTSPLDSVRRAFGLDTPATNFPPRYNIAPTQPVAVIRLAEEDSGTGAPPGERELVPMRWGLVPSWMKELPRDRPLINARAETAHDKPAFRGAYRHRRCLLPADGWFEWRMRPDGGGKQPHLIRPAAPDARPFAFAGIWERWHGPGAGSWLESVAILTKAADPAIAAIHDRMPVALAADDFEAWLSEDRSPRAAALDGLRLADPEGWEAFAVSTRVNSPRNDEPEVLMPAPADAPRLL